MLKLKIVKKWCRHILAALAYLPPKIPRSAAATSSATTLRQRPLSTVKIGDPFQSIFLRGRSELGTPAFMAPELYGDDNDHRVDTSPFNCMLEMVTLETPFAECATQDQVFQRSPRAASRTRSAGCTMRQRGAPSSTASSLRIAALRLGALADPFLHGLRRTPRPWRRPSSALPLRSRAGPADPWVCPWVRRERVPLAALPCARDELGERATPTCRGRSLAGGGEASLFGSRL